MERKSGQALFWALVRNAHSADLLPNDRVAVAASVGEGGNRLVVYDLAVSGREVMSRDLPHGHGVVWDEARQRLYALSGSDIRVFKLVAWETDSPDLERVAVYDLPERGGHELIPMPDSPHLMVSSGRHCWLFDRDTGAITPHPDLADMARIKCMDVNPRTGKLAYVQAEGDHWWAERVHFLHPESVYHVPGEHFYKARWNVPSP